MKFAFLENEIIFLFRLLVPLFAEMWGWAGGNIVGEDKLKQHSTEIIFIFNVQNTQSSLIGVLLCKDGFIRCFLTFGFTMATYFPSNSIIFGHVLQVNVRRCQYSVMFKQVRFVGFVKASFLGLFRT